MKRFILFKSIYNFSVIYILSFIFLNTLNAQISGSVFRDFNANGVKDNTATFNEIGLASIIVTAYNAAGVSVGTATSATDGMNPLVPYAIRCLW